MSLAIKERRAGWLAFLPGVIKGRGGRQDRSENGSKSASFNDEIDPPLHGFPMTGLTLGRF